MPTIKTLFARYTALTLLGLFLIPGVAFWFTGHVEADYASQMRGAFSRSVDADTTLTPAQRSEAREHIASISTASLCDGEFPNLEALRAEQCAPTATVGQFRLARKASAGLLALGVGTLALIAALALLAYHVPRLQTPAFVGGWWSLRAISALEIILQGALLVWLSFWLTAYFFEIYVLKLIAIAGLLAAFGVFAAVVAIFRKTPLDNAVSGELLDEARSPALWNRIRQFAERLGTAPPKQIVGGIDVNFFVTETPLRVQDTVVTGRSLFVSLPLLRAIDRDEADAVLAHELAHFRGGDTEAGAALGPKLNAYAHYMAALDHNMLTKLALYVLALFRAAFELALSRASRTREFTADRRAAELTSPMSVSRALIRIAAYANYRHSVEQELFAHGARHQESLRLGDRVAHGLATFAQSDSFHTSMADAAVPHPFDSHPPMQQRMENVAAVVPASEFSRIVATPPEHSWIEFIPDAEPIEARLWQQYESQFAAEHEQSLAFRYEPANDAERAIVLKYFPDVEFALKKEARLRVTYRGIDAPENSVHWDDVANLKYDEGQFGTSDTLTVTHPDKGMLGTSKTTKLKIAIASKDRDTFKGVVGHYWQRHQVMRKLQAEGQGAE